MRKGPLRSGLAALAQTGPASSGECRRRLGRGAMLIAPVVMLQWCHPAHAQLLEQLISTDVPGFGTESGVTVLSRLRPEYQALGVRVGNFTIRPELDLSTGYDDNVLGDRHGSGSTFAETKGRVGLDYEHSLAAASANLSVDNVNYFSQSRQSYTNWAADLAGSYMFGHDTLQAGFDHFNLTQSAVSLGSPRLDAPLAYQVDQLHIAYKSVFNRLYLEPGVSVAKFDYDNGTVAGAPYLQSYRNRLVVTPAITFGYELSPRRNLVFVVRDAIGNYDHAPPGGARRDFNDLSALAGIDYDANGIWRYRVLVGYEGRSFVSSQYKSIQGPIAEAAVIWSPTGLTTVTAQLSRHIQDSSDDTTAAVTETGVRLQVDHELQRDVLLQGYVGLYEDEYVKGIGNQGLYRAGASVTWLINRNVSLVGAYDFTARRSSGASQGALFGQQPIGPSYNDNRFLVTLRLAI